MFVIQRYDFRIQLMNIFLCYNRLSCILHIYKLFWFIMGKNLIIS